ncbi:MAG: pyruvate dehydrogenase (acetyl-transferring) E1 component subunit alpha [Chloroflexi bacterium]|nr:pyruvate dehydrogenase (acetyl-transferring) E1 component subunit alpha [Chloroflexota bacterium]
MAANQEKPPRRANHAARQPAKTPPAGGGGGVPPSRAGPAQERRARGLGHPGPGGFGPPGRLAFTPEHREELQRLWGEMVLIRRFEERVAEMYTRARIGGYTHLNIGEEATVVGALTTLRPDDYIFSNYRDHGHALVRGIAPRAIMAELFGKETGVVHGRGGSMHIFDRERRFMGGYAIVGGPLALACGAGTAIRYRDEDLVVMCIFGEGSTNIGYFHESLNLAKLWRLPIVFLCVNNQYAMGAPVQADSSVPEIWRKPCAHDMPGERVDGMDLLAVCEAVTRAVRLAREQHEPSLVEALTYRYRGHSMADPARYRPQEEVNVWLARDPIVTFRQQLEQAGLMRPEEADAIERNAQALVDEAAQFAEASPAPEPTDLDRWVYA